MKYKFDIYVLGILILTFLFAGCENNEEQLANVAIHKNEKGYVLKDGYLAFENNESFIKTVSEIINLNNKEREEWEKSIGFVSQSRLINNLIMEELALDSVNRVKFSHTDVSTATKYDYRPKLFYNLISKGVIKLINEGTPDEYWDCSVFNKGFTSFINEDGLYAVGDSLFQVTSKDLRVVKLSSALNKQMLLKQLSNEKSVSTIKKISNGLPGNSPGLIESIGNNGAWTQNNKWPGVSQRIKLGIELTCLAYTLQTARFDFTHNYYVTCQKTNFWNSWINDYANYNVEGEWEIVVYYYTQRLAHEGFSYSGTAIYGIIQPETGERMYAGTTFGILPNEANQTYPYVWQEAYQPKFSFYKWKAKRTDTGQESIVKSYTGEY